jgi:hypothetical protein
MGWQAVWHWPLQQEDLCSGDGFGRFYDRLHYLA